MKRYIQSSKLNKFPKVVEAECEYTGGGIFVFLGKFSDGTYFISDYPFFSLRIVDEDPRPTFWGDDSETDAGYPKWQEEHLVKDVDDNDTEAFYEDLLNVVYNTQSSGYYKDRDIEKMMYDNKHRHD